jgi:hypothetical protein
MRRSYSFIFSLAFGTVYKLCIQVLVNALRTSLTQNGRRYVGIGVERLSFVYMTLSIRFEIQVTYVCGYCLSCQAKIPVCLDLQTMEHTLSFRNNLLFVPFIVTSN